jgi:hypothetical protein
MAGEKKVERTLGDGNMLGVADQHANIGHVRGPLARDSGKGR